MKTEEAKRIAIGLRTDFKCESETMVEFCDVVIKALEQVSVLDKIRADIDVARFIDKDTKLCKNANASGLEVAMQIIDKYKEGKEKVKKDKETDRDR